MYLEIPVDVAQFNADGDKVKAVLARAASVLKDSVKVLSSQEYPMSSLSTATSSNPHSSTSSPSSAPLPPADSTSSYCTATCGQCSEIPDFMTNTECNYNIYQSCCNTRRRSTNSTSAGSGSSSNSTRRGECTPEPPAAADKFTVAEVEVTTTVGRIDDTWRKLNEYDINKEMADQCLHPVVVKYEGVVDVAEGGAGSAGSALAAAASSLGSSLRLGALALSLALTAASRS